MANFSCGRMSWAPLKAFGTEVDFDLSAGMTDEETKAFVTLFDTHDLLVFHGQSLSQDRQVEIASLFGPIVRTSENVGYLTTDAAIVGASLGLEYHSDYAWAPHPLNALSLHAVDVVDNASATLFASAVRALETLPAATRARLETLDADMIAPVYDKTDREGRELDPAAFPVHERRPAVQRCDRTGRPYLLVTRMQALRLFDLSPADSDALLDEAFGQLYCAENVYEHVWRNGDFVIWNNRTIHHARGNMAKVGRRVLQRVAAGMSLHEQYPELAKSYNEGIAPPP